MKKADIFGLRQGALVKPGGDSASNMGSGGAIFGKKTKTGGLEKPSMPGSTAAPGKGQHKPDWA